MRSIFILFLSVFFSSIVNGQSINNPLRDSVDVVLDEVTIKTDIFEHAVRNFAGSVSVLHADKIMRSDQVSLQPVINAVPGVFMQSGTLNTNRITIRGIGSRSAFGTNKIKAYLDEIPLSTVEGETTLEDIDFNTLGGIEVYRGPSSTMYGAGLGGAIHLLTKNPEKSSQISSEMGFGSYGLQRYQMSAQLGNQRRYMSLYYQNISSDGYRENNQYDRESITALGKILLGKKSVLTSYLNYTHLKAYIPSSLDSTGYTSNPSSAATKWNEAKGFEDNHRMRIGLSYHTTYNTKTESTVAVFLNTEDGHEVRPKNILDNTNSSLLNGGLRGNVKRSFLRRDQLNVVLGVESMMENFDYHVYENIDGVNGNQISEIKQHRSYVNMYIATEWEPLDHWLINASANWNYSQYEVQTVSNEFKNFSPVFSPKLSVIRTFGEKLSAYALASHGFSLPTFDESFGQNNKFNKLNAETGYNYEAGIKGNLLKKTLTYELVGYRMLIDNLIVSRTENGNTFGVNAGSTKHDGLEILLNHEMLSNKGFYFGHRWSFTVMKYHFDSFEDKGNDYSGNDLTGVPNYVLDNMVYFKTSLGIYGNVNIQSVGKMSILDDNSIYSSSYSLVNFKFGYQRDFGHFNLNAYAGLNNTLDKKYTSMLQINNAQRRYYYPGLPRNIYGGVKLTYNF